MQQQSVLNVMQQRFRAIQVGLEKGVQRRLLDSKDTAELRQQGVAEAAGQAWRRA